MTTRVGCALAATAALAACGGSDSGGGPLTAICVKEQGTAAIFIQKAQPCGLNIAQSITAANCNAKMAVCTGGDQSALATYYDCLDAVPACTTATQTTFLGQAQQCVDARDRALTAGCKTSITTP